MALFHTSSSSLPSITGGLANFGIVTGFAFSGGRTTAPFADGAAADVVAVLGAGVEVEGSVGAGVAFGSLGVSLGDGAGLAVVSAKAVLGNGEEDGVGDAVDVGAGCGELLD